MDGSLLAFLSVSIVVIVTPGPDTALTIRNALRGGRPGGVFTALGVATGQLLWALATSAGVVAILLASEPVFRGVKLAGAAYLVLLGARSLLAALRPPREAPEARGPARPAALGAAAAYRQGLLNNLGNPKMAVFFASILPQFAAPGQGMLSGLVLLGVVFSAITLVWLAGYAVAVSVLGRWLRGRVRRAIDAIAGAVLVALGVRLAVEPR